MTIKILLAGDGGQGIQTIAKIISQACFEQGFYVSEIPNFGLEQRGGVSLEYLQISNQPIVYPKFTQPNILLIMSDQARKRVSLSSRGANPPAGGATTKQSRQGDIIVIDINYYIKILEQNNISKQSYNIFFLGMFSNILAEKTICKREKIFKLLKDKLNTKQNWAENEKAFNLGWHNP